METFEKYLALRTFINETEKRVLVYGTSVSEFLMLKAVYDEGERGIRRVDLADKVGLTISGVTRAVAPLEKQGYVQTLELASDARVRRVTMTHQGAELFMDMEKDVERWMVALNFPLHKLLREINA